MSDLNLTEKQQKKKEYNIKHRNKKKQEEETLIKSQLTPKEKLREVERVQIEKMRKTRKEKILKSIDEVDTSDTVIDNGSEHDPNADFFFSTKQKTSKGRRSMSPPQVQTVQANQSVWSKIKDQLILQGAMMIIPVTFSIASKLTPSIIQKCRSAQFNTESPREEVNSSSNMPDTLNFTF